MQSVMSCFPERIQEAARKASQSKETQQCPGIRTRRAELRNLTARRRCRNKAPLITRRASQVVWTANFSQAQRQSPSCVSTALRCRK